MNPSTDRAPLCHPRRFLFNMFDQTLPLLPDNIRQRLLAGCRPELLKQLNQLQTEVRVREC